MNCVQLWLDFGHQRFYLRLLRIGQIQRPREHGVQIEWTMVTMMERRRVFHGLGSREGRCEAAGGG